jgi:hypothetical protein
MDIRQKASRLIQQYGDAAPMLASKHADRSRLTGDAEGEETWLRVLWAAEELLAKDASKGARAR